MIKKVLFFFEKYLAALLVLLIGLTFRYKIRKRFHSNKVIYAFWHQNIIPLMYLHKFQNIVILISPSQDGELIAGPVSIIGYKPIRGSSSKKGTSAIRNMLKLSEKYNLAITPDGPKGPLRKLKKGLLYLAYLSKKPIIPVRVKIEKKFVLNSWDNFRIPKLFSKIKVTYGREVYIKNKNDIEEKKNKIENFLNA